MKKLRTIIGCLFLVLAVLFFALPTINAKLLESKINKNTEQVQSDMKPETVKENQSKIKALVEGVQQKAPETTTQSTDERPVQGPELPQTQVEDPVLTPEVASILQENGISYDFAAVEPVNFTNVQRVTPQQISSLSNMGAIAIPELGMNIPIYEGISNTSILVGAGTMKYGQVMGQGNYALASHYVNGGGGRYLFTPLLNAKPGMKVYLTDLTTVYEYEITFSEKVGADRVDLISNTEIQKHNNTPMITLITCFVTAEDGRQAVQGTLVGSYPVSSAANEVVSAFNIKSLVLSE